MHKRPRRSPLSKIYLSLGLIGLTLSIGVIGFILIEQFSFVEALYMTVITLATVGFKEVHPLSPTGQLFTIFIILFNLSIFAYVITQISRYFLDGEFAHTYKLFRMGKKIDQLENHTIVCGYGRNGQEAVQVLRRNKEEFVIIELDDKPTTELKDQDLLFINADATKDEVLMEAGIQRAKALISALPDDTLNVFVILTARNLNPNITLISRASHMTSVRKLRNAGANNVIMPDKIGGAHMAMLVTNPDIQEFVDLMSTQVNDAFQISEIAIERQIGLKDFNCWQTTGATLLGLKDNNDDYHLNPTPQTVLMPGDRIIVMGSKEQIALVHTEIK